MLWIGVTKRMNSSVASTGSAPSRRSCHTSGRSIRFRIVRAITVRVVSAPPSRMSRQSEMTASIGRGRPSISASVGLVVAGGSGPGRATELLRDIDADTVDFVPNYDESRQQPLVLPSRFPNLLVNGSAGIAVGMATNIPPHNLGEVIDALVAMIDEPSVGLAPVLVSRTIDKIKELKDQYNLTVLMAEQNFPQALRIADRGYVIVHGQIAFEGRSADELNNNDLIRQFYLGM